MCAGRIAWIVATALFSAASAAAQAVPPTPICVGRDGEAMRLLPRDDAPRVPAFAEFRQRLREVAARRDVDSLLRVVHPDVKASFGGDDGIESFKAVYLGADVEAFWTEFQAVLSWGGGFVQPGTFAAPYVFANWPGDLDSFECGAVMGRGVRVRSRPSMSARVVTSLDHHIVQVLPPEPAIREEDGWRRVRLADRTTGYIASRYLRSPIDHRALFEVRDGRWWLVAYLAGD